MTPEIKALLRKEIGQLLHKPGAVASAIAFPIFFLLIIPGAMLIFGGEGMTISPIGGFPFPTALNDPSMSQPGAMALMFLPMYVAITGMVLPSVLAIYAVVSEKEKRTIDLLMALPVSLTDIVVSKLLAVIGISLAVSVPLLLVDFGLVVYKGLGDPVLFVGLLFELLAALAFSAASSLVLGLLAKDYRTANNLSGAFMGPMIVVTLAAVFLLPSGLLKAAAIGCLMLVLALSITYVAVRRISLERMAL
jgi:ABC-2 type transport system permease protein